MAGARKAAASNDLLAGEQALLAGREADAGKEAVLEVRAAFLRAVLGGEISWPGGLPRRLTLSGLKVAGGLDLTGLGSLDVRDLHVSGCRFEGAVCLDGLGLEALTLEDCTASSLSLVDAAIGRVAFDRLSTKGHLKLDELVADQVELRRSRIAGVLSFASARIEGDLALRDSVVGTSKAALHGEHAHIGRRLLLDRDVQAEGAVTLTAATIDSLRIRDGAAVTGPLGLVRAAIEELRIEAGARVGALVLDRGRLGDGCVEDGAVVLGPISGSALKVAGALFIGGDHRCGAGPAVDLSVLEVAGDLVFGSGFSSDAAIRLAGCAVGGNLLLRGGLAAGTGNALDISRVRCGRLELDFGQLTGGVSIRQVDCAGLVLSGDYRIPADLPLHLGVACTGRVSLGVEERPTRIEGALSLIGHRCQELTFRNLAIEALGEGRWAGMAVAARHLEVETYLRFGGAGEGGPVVINGVVALDHARLGDDVRFAGARIVAPPINGLGPAGLALSLNRAQLKGDLEFGASGAALEAIGSVDLSGIEVAGDIRLGGLNLSGGQVEAADRLDLQSASVGGALRVGGLRLEGAWTVDLADASVSRLDDDHGRAWAAHASEPPSMEIASLRYGDIEGLTEGRGRRTDDAVSARLAWIADHGRQAHARGAGFSPQPYRTLVAVLTEAGHDNGVKRTEMAARRQQRRLGSAPLLVRLGGGLLELTSGYGYAPIRAAVALLIYYLVGWAGVELGDHLHVFEVSPFMDGMIIEGARSAQPDGCPWLVPQLYALDLMVPLTTLGNENFCTFRAESYAWHWAAVAYRLFGWVLLSIALLTFAGVMKREV